MQPRKRAPDGLEVGRLRPALRAQKPRLRMVPRKDARSRPLECTQQIRAGVSPARHLRPEIVSEIVSRDRDGDALRMLPLSRVTRQAMPSGPRQLRRLTWPRARLERDALAPGLTQQPRDVCLPCIGN